MPDLGSRWKFVNKGLLGRGGQGRVHLVTDADEPSELQFAAKVLSGPELDQQSPRWKRLEEEVKISRSFDHTNVISVVDSGHTKESGYPFFVMPFYSGGSLQDFDKRGMAPSVLFRIFADVCEGVAYVHGKDLVHRDLKPANIFLDGHRPIIGDFGLCFRFEAESLTETMEVATARWFGAPELRNGHVERPLPSADVYSLGKLLYWLFTDRVYDRDEQEYDIQDRKLASVLAQRRKDPAAGPPNDRLLHAGSFADDIVSETVRYLPADRIQTAAELAGRLRNIIARFESGGHALDLLLPQRCLFCGIGEYKPVASPPTLEQRTAPPNPGTLPAYSQDTWSDMRSRTTNGIGQAFAGKGGNLPVPLNLVCNYCGNMQQFRWDRVAEAQQRWRP